MASKIAPYNKKYVYVFYRPRLSITIWSLGIIANVLKVSIAKNIFKRDDSKTSILHNWSDHIHLNLNSILLLCICLITCFIDFNVLSS